MSVQHIQLYILLPYHYHCQYYYQFYYHKHRYVYHYEYTRLILRSGDYHARGNHKDAIR